MYKKNKSNTTSQKNSLAAKLFRATFVVAIAFLFSATLNSFLTAPAYASAYDSSNDLYLELNIYDSDTTDPTDPVAPTDPANPTDTNDSSTTSPDILSPNTAANNYLTSIIKETIISRSITDNWLIITLIILATIGLCIIVVYLIHRYLQKTGLSSAKKKKKANAAKRNSAKRSNAKQSKKGKIKHIDASKDPNTEVINISKLLKKHKTKRILLQVTPVLTFALVGLSASWAVIKSYAATLPTTESTVLTCTPTQPTSSCLTFNNGEATNPLQINISRESLDTNNTITINNAHVLLQNIPNATGSMQLQAQLAETPNSNITNIKLADSATLTTDNEAIAYRTEPGLNTINNNLSISFIIDKTIANGTYPIKINTTLIPDTLQTFNKEDPIYASITPVDGQSTVIEQDNATLTLPDARDNKLYRIRKFTTHPNNQSAPDTQIAWWWMIDNLAFDLTNPHAPAYSPAVSHVIGGETIPLTPNQAQYVTTGDALTADMGYLYNYCAATADTSPECVTAVNLPVGESMPNSICPAGIGSSWRLPKGNSNANLNDFAWLNGLMAGETTANDLGEHDEEDDNYSEIMSFYIANWLPTGVWHGSLSGAYDWIDGEDPNLGTELFGQNMVGGHHTATMFYHHPYNVNVISIIIYLYHPDDSIIAPNGEAEITTNVSVRCVL